MLDIGLLIEAIKLWIEDAGRQYLAENKAVIATAVAGAAIAILVNVHPSLVELRPFIEQIILGAIAAVASVAWQREHSRLNSAKNLINKITSQSEES